MSVFVHCVFPPPVIVQPEQETDDVQFASFVRAMVAGSSILSYPPASWRDPVGSPFAGATYINDLQCCMYVENLNEFEGLPNILDTHAHYKSLIYAAHANGDPTGSRQDAGG